MLHGRGSLVTSHVLEEFRWSNLVDSDGWDFGDLGEKKGDWIAETNADEEDDRFREVVADNAPNLELSCRSSIYPFS